MFLDYFKVSLVREVLMDCYVNDMLKSKKYFPDYYLPITIYSYTC